MMTFILEEKSSAARAKAFSELLGGLFGSAILYWNKNRWQIECPVPSEWRGRMRQVFDGLVTIREKNVSLTQTEKSIIA